MAKVIMTADDSASVRQMVNFTLKQVGYEVVEAVALRGSIEIASARGEGTRIMVRIPLTLAIIESLSFGVRGTP